MKETKFINCEQYVLARMFQLEQENEALRDEVTVLANTVHAREDVITKQTELFHEVMGLLRPIIRQSSYDGTPFIECETIWKTYEPADFERFLELTGLTVPEDTTDNTKEEN